MLTKRIIPCLDVKDGRVVKGVEFVNLRDAGDPVEVARLYDAEGADELCYLDITASHEQRKIILEVVERTAAQVFMPLTVGGGLRSLDDIRELLLAGADKVSINTAAIDNPDFVQQAVGRFGSQCIVVAIDAKRIAGSRFTVHGSQPPPPYPSPLEGEGRVGGQLSTLNSQLRWEVYTHGGRKATGIDAVAWAVKMAGFGAGEILLTSMDRDGTQKGYDLELTRTVSKTVPVPVIASGGAGSLEHLYDVLTFGLADAVLAASIFHYRRFTIQQAKDFLGSKGIPVRRA